MNPDSWTGNRSSQSNYRGSLQRDARLYVFPDEALDADTHEQRHRTSEQGNQETHKGRGTFPDGNSVLMLVTAWLKHDAESEWGSSHYLNMSVLEVTYHAGGRIGTTENFHKIFDSTVPPELVSRYALFRFTFLLLILLSCIAYVVAFRISD